MLQPVAPPPADGLPAKILWAWERPEDLRFIAGKDIGVAFLAQTLTLSGDDLKVTPRRQPLRVDPGTYLIAVTRIESDRSGKPQFSAAQTEKIIARVMQTLHLKNVSAVQIDFDAAASERDFYRRLMTQLKEKLPADKPLSMTALASWCTTAGWLKDMPVTEAVPMAFRMGADDASIRGFLASGKDWAEPLCRRSYGFSADEPFARKLVEGRRVYLFNDRPWQKNDLEFIENFN